MAYKCLIIDDEEPARALIQDHLSKIDGFEIIATCGSAIEAYKILQTQAIDLMFLDIEMPGMKGTDFFKGLINKPEVIFTTAYRDYALEGFNLNAIDYLLKPIFFDRFFQSIEKFLQTTKAPIIAPQVETKEQHIVINQNKKNIRVKLGDINYIESLGDYIKIHTSDTIISTKHSLTSFENKLSTSFLRIHRSFIVNLDKITAFTKQDIEIGDIELPIGNSYKAYVFNKLK